MNKLIYILAVILFAIPALAENVEEDIKISEMEIDGNRVILTDIYGKEVKNNIVHNEEDMINVPDGMLKRKSQHLWLLRSGVTERPLQPAKQSAAN